MTIKSDPRQNPVIVQAIIKDGRLYQMECKEHKNNLMYIILKLHNMGVSDKQLTKIYKHIIKKMDPLLMPKVSKIPAPVHIDDWQDYLGDKDVYSAYLEFFDRQITIHGSQYTLKHFFYNSPLAQSIGSQRSPTIHLALGIQHGLPEIIGQALAYMATFYQDTHFLLDEPAELCNSGYLTAHEILMEQVKVDPRFGSFPSTPSIGYGQYPDNKITYRKILKSTKELLRTYVYLWRVPNNVSDALNELRILAAHMMMSPAKSGIRKHSKDLGTGGSLLSTINAMDVLYPNNTCPITLIRVQFLNVICSYIVQGRPDILLYTHKKPSTSKKEAITINSLIEKMLDKEEANINLKTISAISALEEAQSKNDKCMIFNKVMSCL